MTSVVNYAINRIIERKPNSQLLEKKQVINVIPLLYLPLQLQIPDQFHHAMQVMSEPALPPLLQVSKSAWNSIFLATETSCWRTLPLAPFLINQTWTKHNPRHTDPCEQMCPPANVFIQYLTTHSLSTTINVTLAFLIHYSLITIHLSPNRS